MAAQHINIYQQLTKQYETQLDGEAMKFIKLLLRAGVVDSSERNENYEFLQFLLKEKLLTNHNSIKTLAEDDNYKKVIELYNSSNKDKVLTIKVELQFNTAVKDLQSSYLPASFSYFL